MPASLEQIVATNPSDAEWRATLALAYAHREHYDAIVAGESDAPASTPHWLDASKWLSRSAAIWSDLDSHHKVPAEVADEPAKVAAELARVKNRMPPAH